MVKYHTTYTVWVALFCLDTCICYTFYTLFVVYTLFYILADVQVYTFITVQYINVCNSRLLPPPGGYVITSARRLCNHLGLYVCVCVCVCVCMCVCVYVCVCVCMCVCLSVSTITQEIPNIFIRNFLNAFPIGQGRID
jgi:hypothetical protein